MLATVDGDTSKRQEPLSGDKGREHLAREEARMSQETQKAGKQTKDFLGT